MLRGTRESTASMSLFAALAVVLGCDIAPPTGLQRDPPAPPFTGDTVGLRLQRISGGAGNILVSSGIPLPPGWLRPDSTRNVALVVGGQEKPMYVEALASRHRDGSVRSILVQFRHPLTANVPVPASLIIGPTVRRGTTNLPKTPVTTGMPAAVALPTSADYLVSTELVGRTAPVAQSPFPAYEQNFVTYGNQHWTATGGDWNSGYYERALAWFAYWARSGNYEYWRRGVIDLLAYRDNYAIPNLYILQPHWMFLEALGVHYLLTGDELSRRGIGLGADQMHTIWLPKIGDVTQTDGRIQGRTLLSLLVAWRFNAPSPDGNDWTSAARLALTRILGTQRPDGSFRLGWTYNEQFNWMTGIILDAMVKHWEWFEQDSRIPPAVQNALDFMWNTQWVASAQAFSYATANTPTGDRGPAPDVQQLICSNFSWFYSLAPASRAAYKARADACFNGAVAGAYLQGDKQFNEHYQMSFRHLGYRR